MAEDATRAEVRRTAIAYVAATLATSVAVVLGASIPIVVAAAAIAFVLVRFGVDAIIASRSAQQPRPAGEPRWFVALWLGVYAGFFLGREWFPWEAYLGQFVSDGTVEIPANAARTLVLAGGLGLATWLVVLLLPLQRYPAAARFEFAWNSQVSRDIAPGQGGDVGLFALAVASVLLPPMGAMDALAAPLVWPLMQMAAAFLLTLPLIKKRSLTGALMVYRITFAVYAVLLARLVIGTAPTLPFLDRALLGLAFAGVLALCVFGHVRTARLRDVTPPGGLGSNILA